MIFSYVILEYFLFSSCNSIISVSTQQQKTQQNVTQILQGIQGGQQVTTLVKPATSGGNAVAVSGATQSVTIPVQMQNVQGIKTLRQPGQQQTMVQLRHQLVQQGPRSKIIPQGGQTILATSQGQKVALSQVGGKGNLKFLLKFCFHF